MILILFLFVSLSYCETFDNVNYPLYKTGLQLNAQNPIVTDLFKANTKLGAQFAITHIKPIQVCFHRSPLAGISPVLWNISCQFYYYYPPSPNGVPITNQDTTFIRNTPYYLGIAYKDLDDLLSSDSIDFTVGQTDSSGGPQASDICPDGWVFDRYATPGSQQCIKVARNIPLNQPIQQISEAFQITYYSFDVPDNVGSIMAASDDTLNQLIFVFRWTCTPSDTRKDGTSGSNAYLEYPRPGKYFLSVKAMSKVTTTFKIRALLCNGFNSTAGPLCATAYNNSGVGNLAVISHENQYNYWSIRLPPLTTTSISLLPNNFDILNYELYASKGQLPQYANADISNCYARSCSVILSMVITNYAATEELWFISVMSYTTNHTYAIWFNSTCAPGCETHGVCTTEGPSTGLCVCNSEVTGAACQLLNTKRAHTIVLIIIAVLLGTSAFIGLFASWYLKRHKGYQAV